MTRQAPSIRTRLTFLVLASVLPAAAMVFALITFNYQRDRAQLKGSTVATARAISIALDQRFAEVRAGLGALATSRLLWQADLSDFDGQARDVASLQGLSNIVLVDASGVQRVNTLLPFGAALPRVGDQTTAPVTTGARQLRQIFQTERPVISDLFVRPVTGKPVIGIGIPVKHEGKVAYSLSAGIEPEHLRQLLLRQELPAGWIAAIFDRAGTVVARTHDHERFVGAKGRAALLKRINEVHEDAMDDGVTLDGKSVISVFSRAPESQWAVVIGIPADALTAGLRRSLEWLLMGTMVVLALGLGLAGFLGHSVIRSICDLTAAAAQLGRRQTMSIPPVAFREAGDLAKAFDDAAHELDLAHADLAGQQARLKSVLEAVTDGVLVLDESHQIVLSNTAACRMFGYLPDEILRVPFEKLLSVHFRGGSEDFFARLTQASEPPTGVRFDNVVQGLRRDGAEFPMDASATFMVENGHNFYTLTLRDVTERVRDRDALLRSNLDLQQFAFVASHDLQSPLRSIKGFLGMLSKRHSAGLSPQAIELVRRAGGAVDQMDHLTQDLLSYARLDAQAKPLAQVDCNVVVADALALLDAAVRDAKARIDVPTLPTVQGDRVQLVQLFQNLLGNALTYRKDLPPHIAIAARHGPAEWIFSVVDNGIGMEQEYLQRIFEVFKRLHTQHEYPGNGIGLAICKRVVERHGGRIWVSSQPGQGSTFFFTLPDLAGVAV